MPSERQLAVYMEISNLAMSQTSLPEPAPLGCILDKETECHSFGLARVNSYAVVFTVNGVILFYFVHCYYE